MKNCSFFTLKQTCSKLCKSYSSKRTISISLKIFKSPRRTQSTEQNFIEQNRSCMILQLFVHKLCFIVDISVELCTPSWLAFCSYWTPRVVLAVFSVHMHVCSGMLPTEAEWSLVQIVKEWLKKWERSYGKQCWSFSAVGEHRCAHARTHIV